MRSSANVIEEINLCKDNPQQGLEILNEAILSGIQMNFQKLLASSPKVVELYLAKGAPTDDIIDIFLSSGNFPKITAACLDNDHFPKLQEDFLAYRDNNIGMTFADLCIKYFNNKGHFHAIKLIFEKVPNLINADEILQFKDKMISSLFFAKSFYANKEKCFEETLLAICKHPEFPFIQNKLTIDDLGLATSHPLYIAAECNNKELFDLFYFHPDTHPEAREKAITKACRKGYFELLEAPARQLIKLNFENTAILFYCGMIVCENPLLVREVGLLILNNVLQAGFYDYLETFKQNTAPQTVYANNKLMLFKEGTISDIALLQRIQNGVTQYREAKKKPSSDGLRRAKCFGDILASQHISTGCKLMASYAILTEKTWHYESRIKAHLNTALDKYRDLVDERAQAYADKINLRLPVLAFNLIDVIHHNTHTNNFQAISEKNLLAKIKKNAGIKSSVQKK